MSILQEQEDQEIKNLRISHNNHLLEGLGNGEHHIIDEIPFESPEDSEHFMHIRQRKEELHKSLLKEHQKRLHPKQDTILQDAVGVDIPTTIEGHVHISMLSWFHQGPLSSSSSIMTLICCGILFYLIYSKTFKQKAFSATFGYTQKKSLIRRDSAIGRAAKKKSDDYNIMDERGNNTSVLPRVVDGRCSSLEDVESHTSLRHRKGSNTQSNIPTVIVNGSAAEYNPHNPKKGMDHNHDSDHLGMGLEGFGQITPSSDYSPGTSIDHDSEVLSDLEMPNSISPFVENSQQDRVVPTRVTRSSFITVQDSDLDVESPMVTTEIIDLEHTPIQRNVSIIRPSPSQYVDTQSQKISPSLFVQNQPPKVPILTVKQVPPLPNIEAIRESKSLSPPHQRPPSPPVFERAHTTEQINHHFGESTEGANGILHKRRDLTFCSDAASSLTTSIPFSELTLKTLIGGGGFGQVWSAVWRGTPVAVKVLSASNQKENVPVAILQEFAAEINMLSGMRHPNICLYIGASLEPPNRAIVTELAANGSLWEALRSPLKAPYTLPDIHSSGYWPIELYDPALLEKVDRRSIMSPPSGTWPWALVRRVAEGAARGMNYLHCGKPAVLHRDLKSANVLLDESYIPKVCDFGLSRLNNEENSMTGNCGTVQWMAPEILANQKYAEPADVYSYGIILWELLTRECPYEGMNSIQCAMAVLNRGAKPEIPVWCPTRFALLIARCIDKDPHNRPSFQEILDIFATFPM
jgi:hypothetical protein